MMLNPHTEGVCPRLPSRWRATDSWVIGRVSDTRQVDLNESPVEARNEETPRRHTTSDSKCPDGVFPAQESGCHIATNGALLLAPDLHSLI